jgi:hypothetical protein
VAKIRTLGHLDSRTMALRQAYVRALGCRPTVLEANALLTAAAMTARAERAACNPEISHQEVADIAAAAAFGSAAFLPGQRLLRWRRARKRALGL